MDKVLCDELLQEILHRLPPSSSPSISLVSKHFLHLRRISTTSLSLKIPPLPLSSFSTFLSLHPYLSSLSISSSKPSSQILLCISTSSPNLQHLRILPSPSPVSSLQSLSTCTHLSSLSISLSRPLSFSWLSFLPSLKSLSLVFTNSLSKTHVNETKIVENDQVLRLETLSLCGVSSGDYAVGGLYRNSKYVKNLQLKSCESLGDYSSFVDFVKGLEVVELRSCRSVVDFVLLKLGECCVSLNSLLVYDGGSRESLLRFVNTSECRLKRVDFRLPLDLDNGHLIGLSENLRFRGLVSLRLQSCCVVSGEGLMVVGRVLGGGLEELGLINCDVVERETGLLTGLGQVLKRLRKVDLSYNDLLVDKEVASMLVSCGLLCELKVRGCGKLSNVVVGAMVRSCKELESVDLSYCGGVTSEGVELLVVNAPRLKRVEVEEGKVSETAKRWAANKFIEVVS